MNTAPTMQHLRQKQRSFEENRKSENLIDATLFDEYKHIYSEFKRLRRVLCREPKSAEVATAYDGNLHFSRDPVSQNFRTATRLGETVITVLGEIMRAECPALTTEVLRDKHPAKDCNRTSTYIDTLLYKMFVTNDCLIGSTTFMNNDGLKRLA